MIALCKDMLTEEPGYTVVSASLLCDLDKISYNVNSFSFK